MFRTNQGELKMVSTVIGCLLNRFIAPKMESKLSAFQLNLPPPNSSIFRVFLKSTNLSIDIGSGRLQCPSIKSNVKKLHIQKKEVGLKKKRGVCLSIAAAAVPVLVSCRTTTTDPNIVGPNLTLNSTENLM